MAKHQENTSERRRQSDMSRRKFIEGVTFAATAATGLAAARGMGSTPAAPAAAAGAETGMVAHEGLAVLTPGQESLLNAVLNRLIPSDGALPGAGDVGMSRYIDGRLAEDSSLRRPIIELLGTWERQGASATTTASALDELLTRSETLHAEAFELLIHFTYTGYYATPQVESILAEKLQPPHVCQPEFLDAAMFDEVRQRGLISRVV